MGNDDSGSGSDPDGLNRLESACRRAREMVAGHPTRSIAFVRPNGEVLLSPGLQTASPEMVASIRAFEPSPVPLAISVIASTQPCASHMELLHSIPFVGTLYGLTYVGHSVIVLDAYDGQALATVCRGADLLLVDWAVGQHLRDDWALVAHGAMRTPRIRICTRDRSRPWVELEKQA